MAIYLKPRRGSKANAFNQNIGLRKGEIFLEYPEGRIGREPGRIVIGDGATSYDHINYASTSTNEFQPFITDPSIYIPRFDNSTPTPQATALYDWNATTKAIDEIGNGSTVSTSKLPKAIGSIKKSLSLLLDNVANINRTKYTKYSNVNINDGGLTTENVSGSTTSQIIVSGDTINKVVDANGTTSGWNNTTVTSLEEYISFVSSEGVSVATFNAATASLNTSIGTKANASTLTNYTPLSTFNASTANLNAAINGKVATTTFNSATASLNTAINDKVSTSTFNASTLFLNTKITNTKRLIGWQKLQFTGTSASQVTIHQSTSLSINANDEIIVALMSSGKTIIRDLYYNTSDKQVYVTLPSGGGGTDNDYIIDIMVVQFGIDR